MAEIEYDEDGFPIINEDTIGTIFIDEFEVIWVCEYIEGEGANCYGWRSIGRKGDGDKP